LVSETNPFRLPRTVAPEAYQLELVPDLDAGRFEGTARIQVAVRTPTTNLLLNAADLQIHELHMEAPDGAIVAADFTLDPEHERLRVTLGTPAAPGRWQLVVRFQGRLPADCADSIV
jgi:aminopeptidase N